MKNKVILIVLVLIVIITSKVFAQVEITKSNTSYFYDNNKVDLCFYVVKNTSDSIVFLWFDKEKNDKIPLHIRVHHYIFKTKGDFSFFSIANELRMGSAIAVDGIFPTVNSTFIKVLNPNQSFTVIVKDSSINSFSEDYLEIVPYSIFEEVNRPVGMDWFRNFEYKGDFIVF